MMRLFLFALMTGIALAASSALARPKAKPKSTPSARALPSKPRQALSRSGVPQTQPASAASGAGSDRYSPTKCEWLAVELNANFRETRLQYASQFFCRAPDTVVLSYRYARPADQQVAEQHADLVRETIGQVMQARNWRWVKVEDEFTRDETLAGGASAPAAVVPAAKTQDLPKPPADPLPEDDAEIILPEPESEPRETPELTPDDSSDAT